MDKTLTSIVVLIVILAIGAFAVFNGIYNLGNTEQAVIQRFGEVVDIVEEPGIHLKMPFVDTVKIINVNDLRSIQYGYRIDQEATTSSSATYIEVDDEAIVITSGRKVVNMGAIVQYKIVDAEAYLFNCADQEGTIRLAFESVLRRNMQSKDLDTALVKKEDIAVEVLPELQKKLNTYGLGINITSVKLTDVIVPEPVQEAYDSVNIAENEKDAFKQQAIRYRNEQIPEADANATVVLNEAYQYQQTRMAAARGDVAAFTEILKNYDQSQEITLTRLYIETMERVLAKTSKKFIIDMNSDNMIKYLPLNPTMN
ncbi:MAG: FtsH protease activity modulator HflK [Clostridia bacterium]|nr:FtsH protease activity modulator HflK [Clostridia bacterium]